MGWLEFNALTMACEAVPKENAQRQNGLAPGADASAIHGRLGAQVALLQSPILPTAAHSRLTRKNFKISPLTNHIPVFWGPIFRG